MQKAILVKNGSSVLAKMVYSGGSQIFIDFVDDEMVRLQAKYPTYTFTLYEEDTDSEFIAAVVDTPTEIWA